MNDIKERPILFSAPMVRALLEGRKTQTRRAMKSQPDDDAIIMVGEIGTSRGAAYIRYPREGGHCLRIPCPYGQPGDHLWVRETWRTYASLDGIPPRGITPGAGIQYEALGTNLPGDKGDYLLGMGKCRPSIFMPRWASRITLEIVSVRVERLGDLTEIDAQAEGVQSVADFINLWKSINKSWEPETWIWVIQFRKV